MQKLTFQYFHHNVDVIYKTLYFHLQVLYFQLQGNNRIPVFIHGASTKSMFDLQSSKKKKEPILIFKNSNPFQKLERGLKVGLSKTQGIKPRHLHCRSQPSVTPVLMASEEGFLGAWDGHTHCKKKKKNT